MFANADQPLMIRLPQALALLALCSLTACAFHNTATHWNGHLGADGQPLASGEAVVIFPEGTISLDLEPMEGKTGAARLAQLSGFTPAATAGP